ncbi:MAG: hypothetical protein JWQ02_873 [Capsulimonas sp.]|nr:hypothetical protein [Capsulimonas sp.]
MKLHWPRMIVLGLAAVCLGFVPMSRGQGQTVRLSPGPGPLDNPLKGWCTYTTAGPIRQPYSMVYQYVSWKELEPREGVYDFDAWEKRAWNIPSAAGKRVVFRVYLDYPSLPSGVPDWVVAKGVHLRKYTEEGGGQSPDYDDPILVSGLERLIAALGKRYDRNPRVAFVTVGTLGFWGEWHTYPRVELFAAPATQQRVIDAYRRAFPDKHLQARYPDGVTGKQGWLGYHDDMFPSDTTGPDDWMFLPKMGRAGRTDNWKAAPIGGEMEPGKADRWLGADFARTMLAVEKVHMTWVGPYSPAIDANASLKFLENSQAMVRRMGYQFSLRTVQASVKGKGPGSLRVTITGENQGVAPFYYRWPVRLALLDANHRAVQTLSTDTDIRKWLPGQFTLSAAQSLHVQPGAYRLGIGVIDPMTGRPGVKFANTLPSDNGWTILTSVRVP